MERGGGGGGGGGLGGKGGGGIGGGGGWLAGLPANMDVGFRAEMPRAAFFKNKYFSENRKGRGHLITQKIASRLCKNTRNCPEAITEATGSRAQPCVRLPS